MPRYFDADALRDALYDADAITMKGVRILNQFPTISPDEVGGVGEWEDNYPILVELECLRCKNCNKLVQIGRYCANCGERKKGAEDSE